MAKINKKIIFSELIEKHPETIEILMEKGMHCIGCPMSQQESLEEGCVAHGLDVDNVVKELNEKLEKK
jgi:hybrid cluster-associated redox disulfide protein